MRVLAITKIFPNALAPMSAPFNRQQFEALGKLCHLEVLATIPSRPGGELFAKLTGARRVPGVNEIGGLRVLHPRTPYVPKVPSLSMPLYVAALAPFLARYRGKVDCVLGSWVYPDGCAAIALARILGVPAVVKAHGSDLNVVATLPGARRIIRRMLPAAGAVVVVSRDLGRRAVELGVAEGRVRLVRNGVDETLFHVRDRGLSRRRLGLPQGRRMITFVGNLKRPKGIGELARAYAQLAEERGDVDLLVVGDGPERARLERVAAQFPGRVRLAGKQPLETVPDWVGAADVVTLPSWMEGTPNAVIEALACGRRVVATAVGGVPDLVDDPALGALVAPRDARALAAALASAIDESYEPSEVAQRSATGSWADSAGKLYDVLREVV